MLSRFIPGDKLALTGRHVTVVAVYTDALKVRDDKAPHNETKVSAAYVDANGKRLDTAEADRQHVSAEVNTILPYNRSLTIVNISALPSGTGARYLECIRAHREGALIAKAWRRNIPKQFEVLIDFKP